MNYIVRFFKSQSTLYNEFMVRRKAEQHEAKDEETRESLSGLLGKIDKRRKRIIDVHRWKNLKRYVSVDHLLVEDEDLNKLYLAADKLVGKLYTS